MRTVITLGVLMALCRAALADDPYGVIRFTTGNATLTLSILSVNTNYQTHTENPPISFGGPNTLVSGTNVRFIAAATIGTVTHDPPLVDDWTRGNLTKIEVRLKDTAQGGADNLILLWERNPNDPKSEKSYYCRFGSNWFPNDAIVQLKIKVWYELQRFVGNDPPFTQSMGPEEDIVPVKIYNRALLEATVEDFGANGFYVPNPPTLVVDVAKAAVDAVRPIMQSDDMKHALDPGSYASESALRESVVGDPPASPQPLNALLKLSTVFFATTHGQPSGFRASKIDLLDWSTPQHDDVETYVNGNRTVPGHNFVAMYACRYAPGAVGAWRFRVDDIDKAYYGFTQPVSAVLLNGGTLDEHALLLFQRLAAGDTADEALFVANRDKKPKSEAGAPLNMTRQGMLDGLARLHFVYLNLQERMGMSQSEKNRWYYVKELAGLPG